MMQRFLLEKLIVISDKEKKSKEVPFTKGLNIVLGENKTGKSSILKSIFYTLGCELKLEQEWKKLIDYYLLFFQYGSVRYCIVRQRKKFKMINLESQELLVDTEHFHEYSDCLMGLLGVNVECLTNKGQAISITPPVLFRFQYIDQDSGWNRIGEAFSNMKYILNWNDYSIKYVVGFQNELFYQTQKEINLIKKDIENLKTKKNNFKELIDFIIGNEDDNSYERATYFPTVIEVTNNYLSRLTELEKRRVVIKEKISILKNDRYERLLALDLLKKNVEELNKDHDFARGLEENLKCPFCGVVHANSITKRVEIVKDIQEGNELIKIYREDIRDIEKEINELDITFKQVNKEYILLKKELEASEKGATVISTYKNEGKKEIIKSSNTKRNEVIKQLEDKTATHNEKEEFLKTLNSDERRRGIYSNLKNNYELVMERLNIPISYMQFRNFVQVLKNTGSELPRTIYAYHIALYLYNLERNEGLFNWLVVDTPNQQGQDEKNLKNIDSVLELVLTKEGQFIIGTERETGYEDYAENVIRLTEYKNSLTKDKYLSHKKLLNELNTLGIEKN
ncbi:hypothetical protein ACIGEL_04335 [Rossellomorea aquimaris]|uniref:hypothetical protein n=1 Tax=Rossellomorea aquimaris TaxID=189382 RepID=UPI0037C980C9